MAVLDWKIIFLIYPKTHTSIYNTHIGAHIWKITKHQIRNNMLNYYSWSVLEIGVFVNVFQKFEKHLFEWYIVDFSQPFARSLPFHPSWTDSISMYVYPYHGCHQIFYLCSHILHSLPLSFHCMCELVCVKNPVSIWTASSRHILYSIFTIQNWWYMFLYDCQRKRERGGEISTWCVHYWNDICIKKVKFVRSFGSFQFHECSY